MMDPRMIEVKRTYGDSTTETPYVLVEVALTAWFGDEGGIEQADEWEAGIKRLMEPKQEEVSG